MAESFEEVCANIKACLNSSKRQISLSDLNRDYQSVLGTSIPFRALGYRSLDQLIRNVPDLKISNVGGDVFIDVKLDEKTMHITNLVRGQKCSKKKSSNSNRKYGYRRPPPPRRIPSPPKSNKPANSRYPPKYHNAPKQTAPTYNEASQHITPKYHEERRFAHHTAPKHYEEPNLPKYISAKDPRYNSPRYQNLLHYSAPKYLKVPQYSDPKQPELSNYNSQKSFVDYTDYNQNEHFKNYEGHSPSYNKSSNSKSREPSYSPQFSPELSPQFSPTFSDPEDPPLNDLTTSTDSHGDSREKTKFNRNISLLVTSGNNRKVTVGKSTIRSLPNKMTKQNSLDEDFGYSSMSEIPTQSNDFKKLPDTDFIISNTRKMSLKHSPAAMVAAGRALIESKKTVSNIEMMETSPINISPAQSIVDEMSYSRPFKTANRQAAYSTKLSEFMMDVDSLAKSSSQTLKNKHSSPMYSKPSSTSINPSKGPNSAKPAGPPAPSKMSDPNMFTPGPHTMPSYAEGTACCLLLNYTKLRGLPVPEFKNFNKPDFKTGVKQFLSRVKIGDMNFSSFQLETTDLKAAQEYVAKVALEDLKRRLDSVDSAVLPYTNNNALIIERVAEIVNPHVTGLKSSYIESQYKVLHREILPLNWMDVIENMSLLSVEKLVGGLFVYPASDENSNVANVTSLPELILPVSNTWDVYITFVSSSNKIYFRIIHEDYNGRFETMAENMEAIYASEECKKQPAEIVKEGHFYAALIESMWFRVKAMGTAANDKLIVLLVDLGQVEEVGKDAIYPLDEQLINLPAQAVRCVMTNLEEYCNNSYISEVIEDYIYDKSLVAHVDSRNPRLQLTLHDTSTDEDVNINELILEKIKNELTPPKIPAPLRDRLREKKVSVQDKKKSSPEEPQKSQQHSKSAEKVVKPSEVPRTGNNNLSGLLMEYWESELAFRKPKLEKFKANNTGIQKKENTRIRAQKQDILECLTEDESVGILSNGQKVSESEAIKLTERSPELEKQKSVDSTVSSRRLTSTEKLEKRKEDDEKRQQLSIDLLKRMGRNIIVRLTTDLEGPQTPIILTACSEVNFIGQPAASQLLYGSAMTELKPPRKLEILDKFDECCFTRDIQYSVRVAFFVGNLFFEEDVLVVPKKNDLSFVAFDFINLGSQFLQKAVRSVDTNGKRIVLSDGGREEALQYKLLKKFCVLRIKLSN